jgi:hypothetical protein
MTQGQQRGDHDLINAQPSVEFAPAKTSIRVDWQSAEQSTAGSNIGAAWLTAASFWLVKRQGRLVLARQPAATSRAASSSPTSRRAPDHSQ